MLFLIAGGCGIYLGLYFNILSFLPSSVLAAGACVFSLWLSGQGTFDRAPGVLLALILVQVGYVVGLTARETYAQILEGLKFGESKQV